MRISVTSRFVNVWNWRVLGSIIFLCVIFSVLIVSHFSGDTSKSILSILSLAPFISATWIFRLWRSADSLSESELLTPSEIRRFNRTQQQKMQVYLVTAILAIALGAATLILGIFFKSSYAFTYILTFSTAYAILVMSMNLFEDHYYHRLLQYLKDRERRKKRKKRRLAQIASNGTANA